MGPGTDMSTPLFRKNTLDEMTVGRTEKPAASGPLPEKPAALASRVISKDDPRPVIRAKAGVGSYEDPADARREKRGKGKSGKPGA